MQSCNESLGSQKESKQQEQRAGELEKPIQLSREDEQEKSYFRETREVRAVFGVSSSERTQMLGKDICSHFIWYIQHRRFRGIPFGSYAVVRSWRQGWAQCYVISLVNRNGKFDK